MLSDRLIRIIENHAEELTQGAVKKLQGSPHTPSYRRLSGDELHRRAFEVYHDLDRWLLKHTDQTIQARYDELGMRRFQEGIPLPEVLWALALTKDHLRDWIAASISVDSALDLFRELEIYRLIGHFFDRAGCYAAEAYEREAAVHREDTLATVAR